VLCSSIDEASIRELQIASVIRIGPTESHRERLTSKSPGFASVCLPGELNSKEERLPDATKQGTSQT
jgi:hypothetical protein